MTSGKRRSPGLLRIWFGRVGRVVDAVVPHSPRLVLVLLVIAGFGVAGFKAWEQVAPRLADSSHYALTADHINVTSQPEWILSDIKAEVVRDTGLESGVSVLDGDLANRVAEAFGFHPWVKEVRTVVKRAGPRVDVDVAYRRPVAMIDSQHRAQTASIPIDVDGIRLPGDDLPVAWKERLPRIVGIDSQPLVGQSWNDPRVDGAADLAVLLADDWHKLGLSEIAVRQQRVNIGAGPPASTADAAIYELVTNSGKRIVWGHAPNSSWTNEPTDAEKLADLKRWLHRRKIRPIPQVIDLRRDTEIPRTAREPSASSPPAK